MLGQRLRHWLHGLLALLCAPMALAQALWGPLQPGMTEDELRAVLPQAVKLKRAMNLPGGVRGMWHLPDTPLAGGRFDSVFYFRSGRLWEVAQTLNAEQANCDLSATFGALLSGLSARYGPPRTAQDADTPGTTTETGYWSQAGIDIAVLHSRAPNRCLIRISYKPQLLADASEL